MTNAENSYDGLMDELCLYKRALTPTEVALLAERKGVKQNHRLRRLGNDARRPITSTLHSRFKRYRLLMLTP